MDAAFSSFDESDSLETDVNCFYDLLYEQLDRIAPRRARKPREGSHWWTPELSSMREELKYLLTQKKNPIMAEKLRLVRRNYSSLIRKERSNSWLLLDEGRSSLDKHPGAHSRGRQSKRSQPA